MIKERDEQMSNKEIIIQSTDDLHLAICPREDKLSVVRMTLVDGDNVWTSLEVGMDIDAWVSDDNELNIEFDPTGDEEDFIELSFPLAGEKLKAVEKVLADA